jgi:hypothetical protein
MFARMLFACAAILAIGTLTTTPAAAQVSNPAPAKPAGSGPVTKSVVAEPVGAPPVIPVSRPTIITPHAPSPASSSQPTPQACSLPQNATCPTGATCATQMDCCTTAQGTRNCATIQTSQPVSCTPGYYGSSCQACPGGANNVCSAHGTCSDGITGSGLCSCTPGFSGTSCQYSNKPDAPPARASRTRRVSPFP